MEYFHLSLVMFYKNITNKIPKTSSVTEDLILLMIIKFLHRSILVLYGHSSSVFSSYLNCLIKKIMPKITFLFPP